MNEKAAQRSAVIFQLGRLLHPIYELAKRPSPPPPAEYHIAAARCIPDLDRWSAEVRQFCTFEGYLLADLHSEIVRGAHNLLMSLSRSRVKDETDDARRQASLAVDLSGVEAQALDSISRVPIQWLPHLHGAQTPLSVYFMLRDAIGTARNRLHVFDRYLDDSVFHIYMRDLSRTIEIRLVTTAGDSSYGVKNLLPVARLAHREFTNFRLIQCEPKDLHDRNIRIDDLIFFLGTSVKDAGTHPTNFAPTDSTDSAHRTLNDLLARGTVVL